MFIFVIISIAVLSVLMALWSLWRQGRVKEIGRVKKEIKKKRVIFYRDSSDSSSS